MSHYPSAAELASFRRSIGDQATDGSYAWRAVRAVGGIAFADERSGGIGYSGGSPTAPFLMHEADGGPFPMGYAVSCAWADAYDHSWARKVAGAMRSRAYAGPCTDEATCWAGCTDGGSHVR